MKKYLTLILLTLLFSLSVSSIYAWDDCPKGLVNDPYPGECGGYIDTNNDQICDHSQKEPNSSIGGIKPTPELATITESNEDHEEEYSVEIEGQKIKSLSIQEIADLWQINSDTLLNQIISKFNLKNNYTTNSILEDLRDEYSFSPSQIKDIAEEIKNGNNPQNQKSPYNFILPIIFTFLIYFISYKKYQKTNLLKFNFFWNTALIISSIPSIVFGLFLILRYSFPSLYNLKFDFLYWHVEGSIIFSSIVISHLIQRLNQYKIQGKTLKK